MIRSGRAKPQRWISTSASETQEFGRAIGRLARAPFVIALSGPVGAGKTTLVKGMAQGMGICADDVQSPSFVLVREYAGPRQWLYHADCYRLDAAQALGSLGLEDYMNPRGVLVVEWPRDALRLMNEEYLAIRLSVAGRCVRTITARASGKRAFELLARLARRRSLCCHVHSQH